MTNNKVTTIRTAEIHRENVVGFLKGVRDLLGFIRVENAVLMDEGTLSLKGLYIHKMMMLKDLEETATNLVDRDDSELLSEGIALLFQVQKELNENAAQHLRALSHKTSQKNATNANLAASKDSEGGISCH